MFKKLLKAAIKLPINLTNVPLVVADKLLKSADMPSGLSKPLKAVSDAVDEAIDTSVED